MRLTWVPAPLIKVVTATRIDLTQLLIGGIYLPPAGDSRARVWRVNPDLTPASELAFPNSGGKDDSVALEILSNGDVLVTVSEALAGQGGGTSQPEVHRVVGVFPAYVAGTGTVDAVARAQIAQVRTHLRSTP